MWFVFPQLRGLGSSEMARRYAISGPEEARAYIAHPLLGPRLRESASALLEQRERDPERVLGPLDALKLRSSMSLFARVAEHDERLYRRVLDAFFDGEADGATERLLDRG